MVLLGALFFIGGCSASSNKANTYIVHNDASGDIYNPQMLNEKNEYVFYFLYTENPDAYEAGGHSLINLGVRGLPEYLRVRWKEYLDGEWIEKKIDVESSVPKGFWGHIYVSILADNSLALSWIMKRNHAFGQGTKDCGGYIFEHYSDEETKVTIEKKMVKLNAYRAQKEKDIKAGLGYKYKTPKYYDTVEEADYRCNIYFYL
ncbi:MAG: hypothetical protein ACJAU3_000144 [Zhongshania sp.]|jgi:hypothetical protein